MYPFVPGCSTQKYFPYDEEENAEQYKKVQKQRELERKVRASKRECMMLKDGDPEAFQKASVKLKHNTQQLKTYCSSNDLTYMNERTTVMGYGRSEAGKVTAAYNRALKQEQEKLSKVVDISGGSGIIKQNGSAFEMPNYDIEITEKSIEKVPYVEVIGFSSEKNVKFQQVQKDILSEAKKYPVGTEVSAIYNAETMEIIGDLTVGKVGAGKVHISNSNEKYFAFHNHPDGATLSPADVNKLLCCGKMQGLVATGNNGTTYLMQVLDNVDVLGYSTYISNALVEINVLGYSYDDINKSRVNFSLVDKEEFYNAYTNAIEKIWRAGESFGFRYIKKV